MLRDHCGTRVNIIMFEKIDTKFAGIYRGKVLDNNDPLQLGRIKVEIIPMFKGLLAEELPWATSAMPIFEGAGINIGEFNVPKENSWVWCFFEAGDHNQPVYFAEATDAVHGIPTSAKTNYPNRKVKRTSSGIETIIDDSNSNVIINHPSGTSCTIDSNGKVTIVGASSIDITASGNINIEGSTINLN